MTIALAKLANELRLACQLVSRRVRFEPSAEVAPHQVGVLFKLLDGPRTPGELAELEKVSAPSMTRTTNCLVELGLIERTDHPTDGRSKVLSITDEGRAVARRVQRARDSWMYEKLKDLSPEELEVLHRASALLREKVLA
ncbi:MAG: MarR family transcriptional regulator [Propionicimonas sp.]